MIKKVTDFVQGKAPLTAKRSSSWPKIRKAFLIQNQCCAVCGKTRSLEVHHIIPFHVRPDLELELTNLIVLCEGVTTNCHLFFGHLNNYVSYNVAVREDALTWNHKIKTRPRRIRNG